MKNLKMLSFLLVAALLTLASCSNEDNEFELDGTWTDEDGETVTFNANGTGVVKGIWYLKPSPAPAGSMEFEYRLLDAGSSASADYSLELFFENDPSDEDDDQFRTTTVNVYDDNKIGLGGSSSFGTDYILRR